MLASKCCCFALFVVGLTHSMASRGNCQFSWMNQPNKLLRKLASLRSLDQTQQHWMRCLEVAPSWEHNQPFEHSGDPGLEAIWVSWKVVYFVENFIMVAHYFIICRLKAFTYYLVLIPHHICPYSLYYHVITFDTTMDCLNSFNGSDFLIFGPLDFDKN